MVCLCIHPMSAMKPTASVTQLSLLSIQRAAPLVKQVLQKQRYDKCFKIDTCISSVQVNKCGCCLQMFLFCIFISYFQWNGHSLLISIFQEGSLSSMSTTRLKPKRKRTVLSYQRKGTSRKPKPLDEVWFVILLLTTLVFWSNKQIF